ncbi:Uncharacterized protein GBIM_00031 [Gryllus bimaculatus]|nr:Uncharacterized protein GBIM_00031 [Gryllus bimaculatus]
MSYSAPKLAVRDSFDDEDVSDDVEDEVFIRDGRNGFKLDEERGVKRPLMAPRRKLKSSHFHNDGFKSSTCKVLCIPCCYGFVALTALLGLLAAVVVLIMWFPIPFDQIAFWRAKPMPTVIVPCSEISTDDVWIQTFPKLTSESALQVNDVNGDGVLDIIIGYGSGADKPKVPDILCTLYFKGVTPCGGGLLALDGRNGSILWQHWCSHTVYWVDCGADLTKDGVNDCLISGRGGVLEAINGHDGSKIWFLDTSVTAAPVGEDHGLTLNTYAGRFVQDLDGDGIQDILAAHTEDNVANDSGHLLVVSGNTGRLLHQVSTPQGEESFYPPQILVRVDGQQVVVWGTGGIHSPGGLYVIPLSSIARGHTSQEQALYWDKFKGVMSPPSLVDVNEDGLEDIVVATFNSSVLAFDGHSYKMLWNFSFIGSESSSTPVPGYFNEDNIPDFLVKYQTGPGSPTYFYSQTTVLDGKTGHSLLDDIITDTAGTQLGGLTISVEGLGNDIFLHWEGNCLEHEASHEPFSFMPGELIDKENSVDLCKLRFNSSLVTKFLALSEHLEPPGVPIYSSEQRKVIEYKNSVNTTEELQKYVSQHPDFSQEWATYVAEKSVPKQPPVDFAGENGVELSRNSGSNFRHKEGSILPDQRKGSDYYYSNRDFNVPNRGRNREPGGRSFSDGEGEEMLPSYPSNSEYPDVRKHGMEYGKHIPNVGQWRHWHNSEMPPDDPVAGAVNNYQDVPRERIFEEALPDPDPDPDFDIPGMYYPPTDDGYPPGQRDERTAASGLHEMPHGPRLRGDRRGQERKKRNSLESQNQGVQKLTSAGVLVPSLSNSQNNSIDIVFATYWVPATENIHILLQQQLECVEKKLLERADIHEKDPGTDHLTIALARECLNLQPVEDLPKEEDLKMKELNIKMGQMTVYRLRLSCRCRSLSSDEKCSSILPFAQQSWPTAFGVKGNGYFKPRHK